MGDIAALPRMRTPRMFLEGHFNRTVGFDVNQCWRAKLRRGGKLCQRAASRKPCRSRGGGAARTGDSRHKLLNDPHLATDSSLRRLVSPRPAKDGLMRGNLVRRELNVLALFKGNERYIYAYDDASRAGLVDAFRDDAADPHLSLSWLDVSALVAKAREQGKASADEPPAESRL